eukprot:TRINITY_DN6949_c0_g1_i1.p1 TRINITY_DN6949_c0_g1~~TRINITY_DN6949_c0_g1_i1.p1  ORF type:complete len:283 (-),score=52.22 TRINITY_DN6949_c0_g1_i1:70-918(-)
MPKENEKKIEKVLIQKKQSPQQPVQQTQQQKLENQIIQKFRVQHNIKEQLQQEKQKIQYQRIPNSLNQIKKQDEYQYQQQQQQSQQSQQTRKLKKRNSSRLDLELNCILSRTQTEGILYLGDINDTSDTGKLYNHGVGAVLTVASNINIYYPQDFKINHLIFSIDDSPHCDLEKYFLQGINFIEENRKYTNVLVHCFAGISRSASLVIAYLIWKYSMNFSQAYQFVQKKRKIVNPNNGFIQQLQNFELQIKQIKQRSQSFANEQLDLQFSDLIENSKKYQFK